MVKREPEIKQKDSDLAFSYSKKTFTEDVDELFAKTILVNLPEFKNPCLVAGIDGVGTKLSLARRFFGWRQVGYDVVAMVVNDVIRNGVLPIAFLPYIGRDIFDTKALKAIMKGIVAACSDSRSAIIGGETASMLGFYCEQGQHEIVGCAIGIVERDRVITGEAIRQGDVILGLSSSGLHSNGFSQVLQILKNPELNRYKRLLLTPTKIYVRMVSELFEQRIKIHGIAHITGGGLPKKIKSILPDGLVATIQKNSWPKPKIFQILEKTGRASEAKMYNSFNMGIGMVLAMPEKEAQKSIRILKRQGEEVYQIGKIEKRKGRSVLEFKRGDFAQ